MQALFALLQNLWSKYGGAAIAWLLANPPVHQFVEDVMIRAFAEVFYRKDVDPEFRDQFMSLTAQLAKESTEDGKREVLKKIRALRSGR